jgi:hypothetical protein
MTTDGWSACACSVQNLGTHPPHTGGGGAGRTDSQPQYGAFKPLAGPVQATKTFPVEVRGGAIWLVG